MHGGLLDIDVNEARREFAMGRMKLSKHDERCVALVRRMAESRMSITAIADALSTEQHSFTRNAVLSLGRRVDPPIVFDADGRNGARRNDATRRAKLQASQNLSTHKVRLARAVEEKHRPFGYMPFTGHLSGVFTSLNAGSKLAVRRRIEPRCMWAGCGGELEDAAKDCYCSTHKRAVR